MHLLSVNVEFRYDPIYALGVVTTFDRFMQGYRPEEDRDSIFTALCQSIEDEDPDRYRRDAEQLKQDVSQLSKDDLTAILQHIGNSEEPGLQANLNAIASAQSFKYSRLFAIGLLTIMESVDESLVSDEKLLAEQLETLSEVLALPKDKVEKDVDIYQSNLEKLRQAREVLDDVLKADRKKREERKAEADGTSESTPESSPDSSTADAGSAD